MENARAPMIGVLEKRQGQEAFGTDSLGDEFITTGNYGLIFFEDGGDLSQGLLRVSSIDNSSADLYYLNDDDEWTIVTNDIATGLSLSTCNFTNVEENLLIVNGTDRNMMITGEIGAVTTPMTDSSLPGSLYNSPVAHKAAFYKNRMYLADYVTSGGVRLKTTILRSSYSLGIISLVNGDVPAAVSNNWTIPIVDSKYFYTAIGMNVYEVYRGNHKVATISINSMTETSINSPASNTTFESGYSSFLSSDEIWIYGTYSGNKQYRWATNSSLTGSDVKQYDTFKLVGGDEDEVTLFENIGNVLMISNKNALMTWNDFTLENFDIGVGCVSTNGYVKLKGAIYFLHYSGVFSTTGSVPQLLSRKVERYISGATKAGLEAAAAGYKGLSVFFTIGDVTLYNNDGSLWKVLPDVCLEFNIADQNWYVHTNVNATQFETYMQASGQERLTMTSFVAADNQTLGIELITNGAFDGNANGWYQGPGWSYSSGQVTYTAP